MFMVSSDNVSSYEDILVKSYFDCSTDTGIDGSIWVVPSGGLNITQPLLPFSSDAMLMTSSPTRSGAL